MKAPESTFYSATLNRERPINRYELAHHKRKVLIALGPFTIPVKTHRALLARACGPIRHATSRCRSHMYGALQLWLAHAVI